MPDISAALFIASVEVLELDPFPEHDWTGRDNTTLPSDSTVERNTANSIGAVFRSEFLIAAQEAVLISENLLHAVSVRPEAITLPSA